MVIDLLYLLRSKSKLFNFFHNPTLFRTLSLFIASRNDYKNIDQGILLLEANLKRILRALERLRDQYGLGKVAK